MDKGQLKVTRFTLKKIKGLYIYLLDKYLSELELKKYNISSSNNIQSANIDVRAIKGNNITVLKGSVICEKSEIDSYTFIGFNALISKTIIGRYNSIANNVNIGHGEHPLHFISTSSFINETPYNVLTEKDCIITHDVWIGSGATIRRGVTLGIGSIIGANAFVNKDVPPFAVVGGVPAIVLKHRFPQEKIDRILASKWWEQDPIQAKLIINQLEKEG